MTGLIGTPPFLIITLRVAMETMHFPIVQTGLFLMATFFRIKRFPMNNLAPIRNCPGVQGKSNKMPG